MIYVTKSQPDTSKDGKITDTVKVENGKLIIKDNTDLIIYKNGWYINDFYQGDGARYIYEISSKDIINDTILLNVFEVKE